MTRKRIRKNQPPISQKILDNSALDSLDHDMVYTSNYKLNPI